MGFSPMRQMVMQEPISDTVDESAIVTSQHCILSTAPGKPYTHWKQTVLYFEDTLVAHQGDVLSGLLAVRKSQQNPRDLDVKISLEFDGKFQCPCKVQYY